MLQCLALGSELPWNHCIPVLHIAEPCLLPSPFFHLFPRELSGSGGWKFIICPSSWFADFPPAKSHVCWKKPSIPAQERIPLKEREGRSREEEPWSAWEVWSVSSYSKRVAQVSYRRCTARPRGAWFTVLVQSAKQTDQLGDISKRSWNKVGEEGINSLQGGTSQLTHCQPRRITSLPCKRPLMDFGLRVAAWPCASQLTPVLPEQPHSPAQPRSLPLPCCPYLG